jgi:hypothetical protein
MAWVPVACAIGLSGIAAARLAGSSRTARVAAGTLYAINPVIFERLWAGQVGFLLGYAVLPLAIAPWVTKPSRKSFTRGLVWWALLIGIDIHFLWIAAVPMIFALLVVQRGQVRRGSLASTGGAVTAFGASLAWLALPFVVPSTAHASAAQLIPYRTAPGSGWRMYLNLASLYGFWRREPVLPREAVPGWPLLLAAILVIGVGGWRAGTQGRRRQTRTVLTASALTAFFLCLGDAGPAGWVFRQAFLHIPGFAVMREPQKFIAVIALSWAVFFGWGVESLAASVTHVGGRRIVADGLVLLPLL